MASPALPHPGDRPRLEERLRDDLLEQSRLHRSPTGDLDRLRPLEHRIQATARKLSPQAPEAAVIAARRELSHDALGALIVQRAELPYDPDYSPEPLRIRSGHLERRILDSARDLEPARPGKALARATRHAHRQVLATAAQERIERISGRLGRLATYRSPTREQRIHRVLGDLRRLERLELASRQASEARHELAFRGNVQELKAALERIPEPREQLERSAAEVYRRPDRAIRRMREDAYRRGLQDTIERFGEDPAAFGKLRGFHVSGLGNSPRRSRVLDRVRHDSARASSALAGRDRLADDYQDAVYYRDVQRENREFIRALPSRDAMLAELSRNMEGLPFHEIPFSLRGKLLQDVRKADLEFLQPLREATRRFRGLETAGAPLSAQAQKVATLFQGAPRHVLRRLTPPQMQAALVATSIARRATKALSKAASA